MSQRTSEILNKVEACAEVLIKAKVNFKKSPKSRLTKGYLDTRIQLAQEYWQKYLSTYTKLIESTPSEERSTLSYFKNNEFDEIEETYLSMVADMKDLLSRNDGESLEHTDTNRGKTQAGLARLPKIQLPTFNGKYEEWPAFQDMFISLIHTNASITRVQKLHYLKSSVTGEAESLLRHIQIIEDNYDEGWEILKNRYGNKKLIVSSIMSRLFSQKKIFGSSSNQIKSLLDTTTECLNGLKNQEVCTETWDPIIIYLIVQRLDSDTHKDWEMYSSKECDGNLPTWTIMKKFLESRYRTLELVAPGTSVIRTAKPLVHQVHHVSTIEQNNITCPLCNENHRLCYCKQFSKMTPEERNEYVKSKFICFNCLLPGHTIKICRRPSSCRICHKRHHSLLHVSRSIKDTSGASGQRTQPEVAAHSHVEEVQVNTVMTSTNTPKKMTALLATALVTVRSEVGHTNVLRALIDSGSQGSFITERAAQLLKSRRCLVKGSIVGVGDTKINIKQVVQVEVISRSEKFSLKVKAYVLKGQLTTLLPSKTIQSQNWHHIEGLTLADEEYYKPSHIDILLGVDEYVQIIKDKIIKGPPGTPCAQLTTLGWILFGGIQQDENNEQPMVTMHHAVDVEELLKKFWEVDTETKRKLTKEEEKCEEFYEETHTRNEEGRYVVKLPFNTDNPKSIKGETKDLALKRLYQLERKFDRMPEIRKAYTEVMNEYMEMNHMKLVSEGDLHNNALYLPHHAVIHQEKETTKTRVVFDASCKGTNGISLNDELMIGPTLQEDLRSIIMRWRMHKICFTSDIQKMYRMILLQEEDKDYHRVLWRNNSKTEEVKVYKMQTVTFGTACAPYLAIKTLKQVAQDEGQKYSEAAKIITEDFYVDDLMSGKDTVKEAIEVKNAIIEILEKGKFHLQKWSSNSPEFLRSIDPNERTTRASLDINIDGMVKALGVSWNLREDRLEYTITLPSAPTKITKRNILADLQRLFDPLGWISPVIVKAKILIQKLWLAGKDWDDEVSEDIKTEWLMLREDFENVKKITIQRWLNIVSTELDKVTIHGFCDASMYAMAAVVYCRVVTDSGEVKTEIVAAKTKVAPVKTISLPRLELCGAVMLSKLLRQVNEAMRLPSNQFYAWTDSSVVMAWLSGSPNRWKSFVANRVVEILDNTSSSQWYHVTSENNAADIGSRGCTASELYQNQLWWNGPKWLRSESIKFTKLNVSTDLEKKDKITVVMNIAKEHNEYDVLNSENYESLTEQLKIIVICRRFLNYHKNKNEELITTDELEEAMKKLIKTAQIAEFKEEIEDLEENKHVKNRSPLKSLNPYLDNEHILRVGGRLRNANISGDAKHPIILDSKSSLTLLVVADAHQKTLHGGLQMMLGYLRTKYWIIRAKSVVKKYLHRCVICARLKAKTITQIMGDLPEVRVNPARPFIHSGVDYAGPYNILMSKGRGMKLSKAYVAIFICMSVKAIHLELVSDLSAEAFIAAFRRFVSRRGRCAHLWSDQGRNFVAANKELFQEWQAAKLDFRGNIANQLANDGTQWHFIPPYSPNFGGLWEAGVKSMKHHLKRIIHRNLTYEEFSTLLCQVEACLNSRPLCPLDDADVDNTNPLTPAHFLIGEPTITVPAPDTSNHNISPLARWQYTQKLLMHFWSRWQQEYLSRLQQRPKWLNSKPEFEVGDIVLVKQDGMSPGKWLLGRVVAKHPGGDGVTRVYSVKSGTNVTKRCVTKLCFLPIDKN